MSRLKECDISRDNLLALIWKIDPITFLRARVADKHSFERMGSQLGCIRSVIMNEGHTTKHLRRQGKEVMIKVETTKGYFTTKR